MTLPLRKTAYPQGVFTDFGPGYKADRQAEPALAPAPRLGQDTAGILGELGVPAAEIEALAAAGVLRCV